MLRESNPAEQGFGKGVGMDDPLFASRTPRCGAPLKPDRSKGGGDGGIRTLDRALQPYNGLANRRLQPLGHVSGKADMPDAGARRKRQIRSGANPSRHLMCTGPDQGTKRPGTQRLAAPVPRCDDGGPFRGSAEISGVAGPPLINGAPLLSIVRSASRPCGRSSALDSNRRSAPCNHQCAVIQARASR